jgi:hypothetical protein
MTKRVQCLRVFEDHRGQHVCHKTKGHTSRCECDCLTLEPPPRPRESDKRTGIFYFSLTPGPRRQPITLPTGDVGYVRVEETRHGLSESLSMAMPQTGEHVMNTHKLAAKDGDDA